MKKGRATVAPRLLLRFSPIQSVFSRALSCASFFQAPCSIAFLCYLGRNRLSLYCISLSLSPFPRPLARSLEDAQAHPSSGLHHPIIKFSKLNRAFLLTVPSSSPQKCPESSQPCPVPHRRPELRPSLPPRPGWWTCRRTPGRRARRETA
jgi:hypothetical protein